MTLTNIPLSHIGKVLLELVSHGLTFEAVWNDNTETFTIRLTGGF